MDMGRKVLGWIRKQLFVDRNGQCVRLSLRHILPNGKLGAEICDYDRPAKLDDGAIESLASEIMAAAEADAGGSNGPVESYALLAFFEGKDKPFRFRFRVQTESEQDEDDGYSTEPPTKNGLIGQAMRHQEATMKAFTAMVGSSLGNMQRMLDTTVGSLNTMMDDKIKLLSLVEELTSRKHERELETSKQDHALAMKEAAFEKLASLAPVVVNRLAGRKMLPEAQSPQAAMMRSFMSTLEPEQLEQISRVLKPEQMIVLGEVIQSVSDDTEKKEGGNNERNIRQLKQSNSG